MDSWGGGGKNNREGIYNLRELNSSHLFGLFFSSQSTSFFLIKQMKEAAQLKTLQ